MKTEFPLQNSLSVLWLSAAPLGTVFTYQGRRNDGGQSAKGQAALQARDAILHSLQARLASIENLVNSLAQKQPNH